jgi:hypothetical protein
MGDGERFPITPDELTPEWVTDTLRAAGCLQRARVVSLTSELIGEGVGFLGQIVRVTPAYDEIEGGAPRTLIAKFATPVESARELAAMYGLYQCEVNFYRHLASEVAIRTPRCYFSAISDDATTFLLLLEDLGASGRMGDQVKGCSLDDARVAVRELARLHASWWDHPRLPDLDWLPLGTDLWRIAMTEAYPAFRQSFLDQFGHLLSPGQRSVIPTLNERALRLLDDDAAALQTIVHADFRLDNMFFGTVGGEYEFAVIDWQITNRGWGAYDVAYFMASNLDPLLRRAEEMSLLREYHTTLTQERTRGGVYSWDTCRADYVRSVALLFTGMIATASSLDTTNERGVALFDMIVRRIATAAEELQALDVLV